jgi:quercetin dioxygenase-like cupin family protein/DNA-binding XRE family transcriptional regulator
VSPSMMSQIETGKTQPSVATLFSITSTLRLPLQAFFESSDVDNQAASPVATIYSGAPAFTLDGGFAPGPRLGPHVPPAQRQLFQANDSVAVERLGLVPHLPVEFIRITIAPGGSSTGTGEVMGHSGWEYGFLLRGQLVLALDGKELRLGPGDAVSFECSTPHCYRNDTTEPAVGIWFLTH